MKNLKLNIVTAVLATIAVCVAPSAQADRIGNGNGRTVELAISKLDEKVPGVDSFHKILYAFENGTKIDVEKSVGIWSGLTFFLVKDGAGRWQSSSTADIYLGLNSFPAGPLLGSVQNATTYSGFYCNEGEKCYNRFITDVGALDGNKAVFDGLSLVGTVSPEMAKWANFEYRTYKGVIVGVSRPFKKGQADLCVTMWSVSGYESLFPVEPGVCAVIYLYNKKSIL